MTNQIMRLPRILPIVLILGLGLAGCSQQSEPTAVAEVEPQQDDTAQRTRSTERLPAEPLIKARALSLSEMTHNSTRIVQGTVRDVSETEIDLDGKGGGSYSASVQVVEIEVESVIKGNIDPSEPLVVRQYANLAQPVEPGEKILWYLPDESELGLSAPLGVYSGHFKVTEDERNPGEQVVLNLAFNEGLWTGNTVWTGAGLSQDQFEKNLSAQTSAGEYARIMALASRPYRPGPIPLKLITTASAAIVEESQ